MILRHENRNVKTLSALAGQPIFIWGVFPLSCSITPTSPLPQELGLLSGGWAGQTCPCNSVLLNKSLHNYVDFQSFCKYWNAFRDAVAFFVARESSFCNVMFYMGNRLDTKQIHGQILCLV